MKLYNCGNAPHYSELIEASGASGNHAATATPSRLIAEGEPSLARAPPEVRIHYRESKPLPLPDFHWGSYLMFVSDHGKSVLEACCAGFVAFSEVEIVGFGIDNGKSWREAGLDGNPFASLKNYHVLHPTHQSELVDEHRTTVVRTTLGEVPELLPCGEIANLAFRQDIDVPPLFTLRCLPGAIFASETLVRILKRERVVGFKGTAMFDTDADFRFEHPEPMPDSDLVSMREALDILAGAKGLARS